MTDKLINQERLFRQHLEMEAFFTGDFTLKGKAPAQPTNSDSHLFSPDSAQGAPIMTDNEEGVSHPHVHPSTQDMTDMKDDSLEKIAGEVRACCKCEIGNSRIQGVPGQGNPRARLMFVGEAPGADEDQKGIPFIGRAGKLLTDIITAMGLTREEVFITNIVKSRPPGNRDPKAEEIINCWPYLQRQLKLIRPDVIVALGAPSARTLLKTNEPIGKLRGRFFDFEIEEGRPPAKLMPTYHPAYLLRNYTYDTRKRVWEDMCKVLKELGLPVPEKKKGP